jgi:uncharacterized small protein (DUF1192 family)
MDATYTITNNGNRALLLDNGERIAPGESATFQILSPGHTSFSVVEQWTQYRAMDAHRPVELISEAEERIAWLERECKRLADGPPTQHPPEFVAKVLMDREGRHDPMELARLTEVIRCARLDGRKLARDHVAALEAEIARLHDELNARTDERDEAIADAVGRLAADGAVEVLLDEANALRSLLAARDARIRELDDILAQRPAPVPDTPKPVHDFTRPPSTDRRRMGA